MKDANEIDILQYIGTGHDNGRTADDIARLLDIDERLVRNLVSEARYKTVILNLQDGYGYFFPTEDEEELVFKWLNQEEDRLKSHASSLHAARQWRKERESYNKKIFYNRFTCNDRVNKMKGQP